MSDGRNDRLRAAASLRARRREKARNERPPCPTGTLSKRLIEKTSTYQAAARDAGEPKNRAAGDLQVENEGAKRRNERLEGLRAANERKE